MQSRNIIYHLNEWHVVYDSKNITRIFLVYVNKKSEKRKIDYAIREKCQKIPIRKRPNYGSASLSLRCGIWRNQYYRKGNCKLYDQYCLCRHAGFECKSRQTSGK